MQLYTGLTSRIVDCDMRQRQTEMCLLDFSENIGL